MCAFFFAWLGIRMMIIGARLQAKSYQEFNLFLFGERIGGWMNYLVSLMLLGVTIAMLAGAGALFEEQLGLSFHIGVLLTFFFSYMVIVRGMDGILSINSLVVPMMLVFTLVIGWMGWQNDGLHLLFQQMPIRNEPSWLLSAISYMAFNLVLSQSVLVPLGASIQDESVLRWGGWLGGIGLGAMLIVSNLVMQLHLDEVLFKKIPIGWVISDLGQGIHVLFILVIWSEILTTLIGDIYGLIANLRAWVPLQPKWMMISIFLFAYLMSFIGFPNLVRYLYPVFGYCGMFALFVLLIRRVPSY